MAPKSSLFQRLQHIDDASSAERQAARLRRQQQNSGEILQTFLAYKLDHAADKMALGIAIGDALTLLHEPSNQWDPNAVKVFWKEQWIGYVPKNMAALIAREVPEAKNGLAAVVTGLTTTSRRDAFRLQIAIPIPRASQRLRELGVSSSFAWDFDRSSGADKLRLVISCSEAAFRELQELLSASFDVSKCGYSYYPAPDGRHYPWYLSVTDSDGRAPQSPAQVEQLIRAHFGVASETTRVREHQERLQDLEQKQLEISTRLESTRAEKRRLQREYESSRSALERRATIKAVEEGEQAIELAQTVEEEWRLELNLKEQELQLALADNQTLTASIAQISNELEVNSLQLEYFNQVNAGSSAGEFSALPWSSSETMQMEQEGISNRLLQGLRSLAGRCRLRPSQCLELVSEELCPGHLQVLESAWRSADDAKGFEYGDRLFELLWLLANNFRQQKLAGAPDLVAGQLAFGNKSYAARESQTIENNQQAKREGTFHYNGKTVEMWQHLKIGVKDSENRTLRIHFFWDSDLRKVVIGHCGRHLHVPSH